MTMMNWLKNSIILRLLRLVISFKKLTMTQKLMKLKKILDHNHDFVARFFPSKSSKQI